MGVILASLAMGTMLAACDSGGDTGAKKDEPKKEQKEAAVASLKEIVIYSGRKEQLIKPILDDFEKKTGIKAVYRFGGGSELANAILEEKNNPKADVFLATDAGTLEMLKIKGALEPFKAAAVNSVPSDLRAADNSWIGVSGRVRVIMYNTNLVKDPAELPKSMFDLTNAKYKGQVAMAKSNNESLISQVSAIRVIKGEDAAKEWIQGLMKNDTKFLGGHTDVRKAVGKGEFKYGIVNQYYYHLEKKDGSPVAVIYPDQGEGQMGALMNVSGLAKVKGSKNADAAEKFIEFVLQPETQALFGKLNFEMPTRKDAAAAEDVLSVDKFKRTPIPLEKLGSELDKTMNLLEKLGTP